MKYKFIVKRIKEAEELGKKQKQAERRRKLRRKDGMSQTQDKDILNVRMRFEAPISFKPLDFVKIVKGEGGLVHREIKDVMSLFKGMK